MQQVIWAPAARSDLDRIGNWLDDNRGLEFSVRTLHAIRVRANFLAEFPHGGRPIKDKRVLVVIGTPYVIVYRLRDAVTEIVRVHHEREDWQAAI